MGRNTPYRDNACVAEMSRKCSKGGPTDVFHESDLILGSVTDSLVEGTTLERLFSAINEKEAAPSRIINVKAKSKVAHKRGTVNKMVANSRYSVVTPEYLARTLNIGLDKSKQMLLVTNQCGICTAMHPISRRYRTYHLGLLRKCISVRWYVDWMISAEKMIMKCRCTFV